MGQDKNWLTKQSLGRSSALLALLQCRPAPSFCRYDPTRCITMELSAVEEETGEVWK